MSSDFSSAAFLVRTVKVAAGEAEVEREVEEEAEAEEAPPAGSSTPLPASRRSRAVRMPPCMVLIASLTSSLRSRSTRGSLGCIRTSISAVERKSMVNSWPVMS